MVNDQIIHPTSIIHPDAEIGESVKVGPYCVVGGQVSLGNNVVLHSHVSVDGNTKIGDNTEIFPFSSIGHVPQDLKYKGEKSKLEIGNNNVIREHVTINPGTEGGGLLTKIGNNCLFMVGSHIAHDCIIGNHVVMANNATLAGHVIVENNVVIGGLAAIHQFVRIGKHAMIGGMSGVENDVIPYGQVMGERANLVGLNLIGIKRSGVKREEIHALRNAYKALFASHEGTLKERIQIVEKEYKNSDNVKEVLTFISAESERAICQPKTTDTKQKKAA